MDQQRPQSGAWYDLTPADYAKGLRFNAQRSDECAAEKEAAPFKPWSAEEIERDRRSARRLRAMALLCDIAPALRAGDVDFLGMNRPDQSLDDEVAAIATAHQRHAESINRRGHKA